MSNEVKADVKRLFDSFDELSKDVNLEDPWRTPHAAVSDGTLLSEHLARLLRTEAGREAVDFFLRNLLGIDLRRVSPVTCPVVSQVQ